MESYLQTPVTLNCPVPLNHDSFPPLCFQLHSDVDTGDGNIKYILSGEGAGTIFVIDDKTGNIHATKTLDREEQAEYTLTAQAVARDTNKPLEPPSEFIVKVQDINDNPPEFLHGPYYARVAEMSNVGEIRIFRLIFWTTELRWEKKIQLCFLMHYSKPAEIWPGESEPEVVVGVVVLH